LRYLPQTDVPFRALLRRACRGDDIADLEDPAYLPSKPSANPSGGPAGDAPENQQTTLLYHFRTRSPGANDFDLLAGARSPSNLQT